MNFPHSLEFTSKKYVLTALLVTCSVMSVALFESEIWIRAFFPIITFISFISGFVFLWFPLRVVKSKIALLVIFYFFLVNSVVSIIVFPFQLAIPGAYSLIVLAYATVIPGSLGFSTCSYFYYLQLSRNA